MKAVLLKEPGVIGVTELEQRPVQPGEALLKIHAAGICGSDIGAYRGTNGLVSYPRIIGHELAGEILSIPEDNPKGLKVGDIVISGPEADIKPGNALPLANIPVGTLIHNVELQPGKGAAIARSAGTSIQLMGKEGNYAILRMPSSEMRRVLITCRATIGEVGNAEHSNIKIGKAGRKRWMGVRPSVRGTVMNPVDHPHGGGEGKNKSAGRHPVTPWGVPTKGHRTRNKKKASSRLIIRRRKK